jgi:hypothetical protein
MACESDMEGEFMYHLSPEVLLAAPVRFEKKTQCTQVPMARECLSRSGLDFKCAGFLPPKSETRANTVGL